MSAAELLAVIVARHPRYDRERPKAEANDHLIFSKGHASPPLCSVYKAVGVVSASRRVGLLPMLGQGAV